jgi:hypothetical protein
MTLQTQAGQAVHVGNWDGSVSHSECEEARQAGQSDALSFAAALAAREARAREDRITQILLSGAPHAPAVFVPGVSQEEWERLLNFHRAVVTSRSWFWVQRLRRLLGREW